MFLIANSNKLHCFVWWVNLVPSSFHKEAVHVGALSGRTLHLLLDLLGHFAGQGHPVQGELILSCCALQRRGIIFRHFVKRSRVWNHPNITYCCSDRNLPLSFNLCVNINRIDITTQTFIHTPGMFFNSFSKKKIAT